MPRLPFLSSVQSYSKEIITLLYIFCGHHNTIVQHVKCIAKSSVSTFSAVIFSRCHNTTICFIIAKCIAELSNSTLSVLTFSMCHKYCWRLEIHTLLIIIISTISTMSFSRHHNTTFHNSHHNGKVKCGVVMSTK